MADANSATEILARSLFDEAEIGAERGLIAAMDALGEKVAKSLPPEFGKTALQAHKRKREKRWERDQSLFENKARRLLLGMGADPTAAIRQTSGRVSKLAGKLVNVTAANLLALDEKTAGTMAKNIKSVSASALSQAETPEASE